MADRPTASASRVGRPRTRSVHQTPHVPSSKVGGTRSKSVHKSKVKDSAKEKSNKVNGKAYSSIGTRHCSNRS